MDSEFLYIYPHTCILLDSYRDVESGAFSAIDALTSRVKNGVNLVVTKTANKVTR